ncbi:NADPH:quinone oxidoreductase-like [Euphorbia lathyris]|uniref:NADPH:quinone oxidoreductase-like n=1 Tax=Euphorbia lathyris TaxID=212925 RepID=UPI003313344E
MDDLNPVIKIAAMCGSLGESSFNINLIRAAIQASKEFMPRIEIEHIDISSLPVLNTDLIENGNYPLVVEAFRQQILKSDCFLFAAPAYYSLSGPLNNAFDWASQTPNCWEDKQAAMLYAGGGFGGEESLYSLQTIGILLDFCFIDDEFFLDVYQSPAKFDDDGNLIDDDDKIRLEWVLVSLRNYTLRKKNARVRRARRMRKKNPNYLD